MSTAPGLVTPTERVEDAPLARHITCIRLGHGANCSSIGSVVDTLFVVSAVSGAVVAAIAAAMASGTVRVVSGDTAMQERDASGEATQLPAREGDL